MDVCLRLFLRVVKKMIRVRPDAWHFVYACLLLSLSARAQFTITENFKSSSAGNVTLGGAAKLTSGVDDPAGQGWLRLTEDVGNQVGYAFVNAGFPSTLGVLMDFEYVAWRRTNPSLGGGDGFSVFLFDDNITAATFKLGSRGGSLGYAQSNATGNTGLAGGYVGVGIDEYGNYANCSEGKSGGVSGNCGTLYRDYISARGPSPTYSYLGGSSVGTSLDYDVVTSTRPTPTQFYRRVQVTILPTGTGQYTLTVKSTNVQGGTLQTLFGPITLTSPPPARMKLGFAASTGGAYNRHEVRNLIITTPGNIRVQKLVDKPIAKVGDALTYKVTVYNETTSALTGLPLQDVFSPANGFNISNVTFSNDGFAGNTATGYTSTSLSNATLNMQSTSTSTFTVTGTVASMPPGKVLTNKVWVTPSATGITDPDASNDTSSVSTNIIAPDLAITKTHNGNLRKGLTGNYVLNIANGGVDAKPDVSQVTVTDVIPTGLTINGTPTGTGWSISVSGATVTATRQDALAAGASYPPITIPVKVSVSAPDSVTNTATVANAYEANTANNIASDKVDTRRNMDLQVVSSVSPPNKQGCLNTPYNIQINIRNNGPDSAVNGKFSFSVPTAINNISLVSRTITAGSGSFGVGSSISNIGYTDSVTLTSGAAATYIFSVIVTTQAPADLAIFEASLLRSATDLDTDASDPTLAVPVNPNHECDAAPSGGGCNNILRDTTFVRNKPTPSNAGIDQAVCNVTSATLNGNNPVTGTGTWRQLTGPNTVTIANPGMAGTSVSNLITGTYTFEWAINNGSCAASADTMQLRVDAPPSLAVAGPDQNLCSATTTTMAATAPVTGTGGWRQLSGPNTAVFADATKNNTGVSGLITGSYMFVWTTRNGSCPSQADTITVTINTPGPAANAGPDQQLCNVTGTVMAGNAAMPGTGTWTQIAGPNNATIVSPNQNNTALQNLTPGIYQLVWTIRNGACAATADTVQVTVYAPPTTANAGPDQTKYNNGLFTMSANAPVNGTGSWAVISGTAAVAGNNDPNTNVTLQPNTSATLTWTITNGNCPPSVDTVVLTFRRQADLKITKSDAGNTYKTGSPLVYTLTVENLGPSDVSGASIQDVLPALMSNPTWTAVTTGTGVTASATSGSGSLIKINVNIPFAAGNKIVVTVKGTVAATAKGGDVIENMGVLAFPADTPDPDQSNNTSTVTGTVPNNPPIAVNDQYTTPRDVAVSGNVLTNDSDPESQPLTVTTTPVTPPARGQVVQRADGTFTYTPNPGFTGTDSYVYQVCDNQGACATATVTIQVTAAVTDLVVTKTATPASAVAGQPLTYKITITNNGPSTIQPNEIITVADSIPAGFLANTFTPSEGTYDAGSQQWKGLTMPAGKSVVLTIAGKVESQFSGSRLRNVVYLTPPAGDIDPGVDSASVVTPVSRSVEVTVEKTDNTPLYVPGTTTQYKITIVNKGPSDLTGATFRDPLPAGITVASWTAVSPDGAQPAISGNGAIDQPLNVPAGSKIVYTLTLNIPSSFTGALVNTATVTVPAGYTNINPAGNTATDTDDPDLQYNITVSKSGPAQAVAGDSITYQLQITNSGPSDLVNATVADILPAAIRNAAWTVAVQGSATAARTSGTGNVNFTGSIPAGSGNSILVTIKGLINSAATGSFTNTATVTPAGKTPVSSNTVNTVINNRAGLTLSKAGPASGTVVAGNSISYLIRLTNAGPSDANGIVLQDAVPANIQNVTWNVTTLGTASMAAGAPMSGSGNTVRTTVNVPAGAGNVVEVQVNGDVSASATDTLTNTASATLAGIDTATATSKTAVLTEPGIQVQKAGPATVNAGTAIVYTIKVGNTGPSDAVNATITDLVGPNSIHNVSWTATASGAAVVNSGTTGTGNSVSVNANIPAGANNEVTITITGTVMSSATGNIVNTATVAIPGEQPVNSNEVVTAIAQQPGLVISKQGPANATAGGILLYVLKLTNTGPSDAYNVAFADTIAAAVQNPSISATAFGNAKVESKDVTNNIAHVIADLPAGDSNYVLILIGGKIDPAFTGQFRNQATADAGGGHTAVSPVVVTTVSNVPALELSKSAPDTVAAGQSLTYTVTVGNHGLSDAQGAVITDAVPAGLTNVSWTATAAGRAAVTAGATGTGNNIQVTGDIPTGNEHTISIIITGTVSPSFTGVLTNHATGTAGGQPPVMSDTVNTVVLNKPQLQITKSAPASISAGGQITYVITVTNAGPSDAQNVSIADMVDTTVRHVQWQATASGGAVINSGATGSGNQTLVTANIPAGTGRVVVTIQGTVNPAAAGTLGNVATAGVTGQPAVETEVSTQVHNNPQISLSKTGPAQINAGEQISYRLVATNYGLSDARNLKIQDVVPQQITNVSWTASVAANGAVLTGNTGTGNNILVTGNLPAGTGNHIFVDVTGTVAPGYAGVLRNSGYVAMQAKDTVQSDTVVTTVQNKPSLQIVKTAPDTVAAGGAITFTLTVTNPGPSDATSVTVTDAVPAFVQNVSWSAEAKGSATLQTTSGTGSNNIPVTGTLPAGAGNAIIITIHGTVDPAFTGDIPNMAQATAAGQPPVSSNTTTTHVVKQVSLAVIKAGPDRIAAGAHIAYLIGFRNYGPSNAAGVQFRDTVPAAIQNVTWDVIGLGNTVITAGQSGTGNQIAVTADMPSGTPVSSALVVVQGTVDASYTGPALVNVAQVSSVDQPIPARDTAVTTIYNDAKLDIVKSGPGKAFAGDSIKYTIHLANNGPSDAVNIAINDVVDPAILQPVWTATATGTASVSTAGGTGNVTVTGNIPVGAGNGIDITVTGTLNPDFTGTSLSNTATAVISGQTPVSSTVNTTVGRSGNLRVVKSAPGSAAAGTNITYVLTVRNAGPSNLKGVAIHDAIPSGILQATWTAVSTGPNTVVSAGSGTGNVDLTADMAADTSSVVITVKGRIDPATANGTNVSNTVTATPPAGADNPQPVSATAITVVSRQADLVIVKSGPANINAGQDITYQLQITNRGESDVDDAVITDVVPSGIIISSATATTTGNAAAAVPVITGNTITLTGDIAAGNGNSILVIIKGTVDPSATGTISNTATVTPPADVTETIPANNSSSISTVITTDVGVQVSKSGPASVNVNDPITYSIVLTNNGLSDATGITITDAVPADITVSNWTATVTGNASVTPASGTGNNISLTGMLGGSSSGTITITVNGTVKSTAAATITNTVVVEAGGTKTSSVVTSVNKSVDLRISKSGPTAMFAGEAIDYILTVTNNGPADAMGATIQDLVPAGVMNVTWTATVANGAAVTSNSGSGNNISLNANIPANSGEVTIHVKGVVNPAFTGTLVNTATATPPAGVTDPLPATATVNTVVTAATGITIVKSGPANVQAGNGITYTLLVRNNGPSDATGVVIRDTIPAGVANVNWQGVATNATIIGAVSGTGNVNLTADIPAGGTVTVTINGTTDPAFNGTISNRAVAGTILSNTVDTRINNTPGLVITKSGPATIDAGSNISYSISVANNGPSTAVGATISDVLPQEVQNATWSATAGNGAAITGGNITNGSGNVSFKADIPAGGTIMVMVNGQTDAAVTTGTITNVAAVTPANGVPVTDTAQTILTQFSKLRVVKAGPDSAAAGSRIAYTIDVYNDGPSDAVNMQIADVLPAQLQQVTWSATATGAATINGGNLQDQPGNVALIANVPQGSGHSIHIMVSGVLQASFAATDTIGNTATATLNNITTPSNRVITIVYNKASVQLSKSGPATVAAGGHISYNLVLSNGGPSDAANIQVSDILPLQLLNPVWSATAFGAAVIQGGNISNQTGNVALTAGVPAGAGNRVVITIEGDTDPALTGTVTNTASYTFGGNTVPTPPVVTTVTSKAALQLSKSGPDTLAAGSSITYTLQVTNSGPSNATNVTIADVVPATVTNVTWTAAATGAVVHGSGSGTGNNISINADMPAGSGHSVLVTVTGTIASNASGIVKNTATVSNSTGVVAQDSVQTQLVQLPGVVFTKSGPEEAAAGNDIVYTLNLSNTGPSDLLNATVTDIIPSQIRAVSWKIITQGAATLAAGTPVSGTTQQLTFKANVPAGAGNGIQVIINGVIAPDFTGTIANTAQTTDNNGQVYPSSVTTTVSNESQLAITKTGPQNATAGSTITYVVTATNLGPSNAEGVRITDVVPAGVTNVTWQAAGTGAATVTANATGSGNNVNVTGNIDAGPGNSIRIIINGRVASNTASGGISNSALLTTAEGRQVPSDTVFTSIIRTNTVELVKIAPATAAAGDSIQYDIIVSDPGVSDLSKVTVQDIIPATITGVRWTASVTGAAQVLSGGSGTGNTVNLTAMIPAGGDNMVHIVVKGKINPAFAGVLTNNATATAEGNTFNASATTTVQRNLDLAIAKSGPPTASTGDTIHYVLTARNNGLAAGDGAVITDVLPAGINDIEGVVLTVSGGAGNVKVNVSNRTVTATIGTFPAGGEVRLGISGVAPAPGTFSNTATITAPNGAIDTNPANNTSGTIVTKVEQRLILKLADLQLKKVLMNNEPLQTGGKAVFRITLTNAGPDSAQTIVVRDTLTGNLDLIGGINVSAGITRYDAVSRIVVWEVPVLASGQTATMELTARINSNGTVVNVATATSAVKDPDLSNNTAVTQPVTVSGDDIFIPNVITPNGDGRNDRFIIIGISRYPNSSLFIYNRWGNQVYQSKNYQNEWDGHGLSEGTYYYVLKLRTAEGGERSYKGWIELMR
nr:gliding motility-associated C-terminal domain-containing protein [uncultured Chitinophaga sp.]